MKRLLALSLVCCLATVAFANEPFSVVAPGGGQIGITTGDGGIAGDTLWDNGDTDGSNGYSNAPKDAFGYKRSLLDDFVVDDQRGWVLQDLHTYQIWNTLPPGSGTDFELHIRDDAGGAPGNIIASATSVSYSETATGRNWFGRDEYKMDYYFGDIFLGPGTYWIEGNAIGPENNFWMIKSTVTGSPCWVNYEDYGFMEGSGVFGAQADLAFSLTGYVVPEPTTLGLLAIGGLALLRRR